MNLTPARLCFQTDLVGGGQKSGLNFPPPGCSVFWPFFYEQTAAELKRVCPSWFAVLPPCSIAALPVCT